MGEHFDAVFNNTPEKSNFAAHIISTKHLLSKCSFRPLHTLDKGKKMTALENLEIIKALADDTKVVVNEVLPLPCIAHHVYSSSNGI